MLQPNDAPHMGSQRAGRGALGSALSFTGLFPHRMPSRVQETCDPLSKRGGGWLTRVGSGKAGIDLRGKAAGTAIRYLLRTADALLHREARCLERRGGA